MMKFTTSQEHQAMTDFVEALLDKYERQEELDNQVLIPKDRRITTDITYVGFGRILETQKALTKLINIDLSKSQISRPGDLTMIRGKLNNLQTLNLASNFLNSWADVLMILRELPSLKELILSENPLAATLDSDIMSKTDLLSYLPELVHLTLGRVYLDWPEILSVIHKIWPNLLSLDLWNNELKSLIPFQSMIYSLKNVDNIKGDVKSPGAFLKNIKYLTLSYNTFEKMLDLEPLMYLPDLEQLDISNCHLKQIEIPSSIKNASSDLIAFKSLKQLNISFNSIKDVKSIAELEKLPSLTSLLCHGNPVFLPRDVAKIMTIGRLGKITQLNRETITNAQRHDCEVFYLRRLYHEYCECFSQENLIRMFKINNPRYEFLLEHYGTPDGGRLGELVATTTKKRYITIKMQMSGTEKQVSKRVPSDMTIGQIKMFAKRLLNLSSTTSSIELTWAPVARKHSAVCVLDKEGQDLNFYSIEDGDLIFVNEK